jgi:hypothetical protein
VLDDEIGEEVFSFFCVYTCLRPQVRHHHKRAFLLQWLTGKKQVARNKREGARHWLGLNSVSDHARLSPREHNKLSVYDDNLCLRNVEKVVVKERVCRRRLRNASVLTERTLRRSAKPRVRLLLHLYLDVLRLDYISTLQTSSSASTMVKAVRGIMRLLMVLRQC